MTPEKSSSDGGPIVPGLELDTRVAMRLDGLHAAGDTRTLRRFAVACAERVRHSDDDDELLVAVRAAADGDVERAAHVRGRYRMSAMGATISGLSRRLPSAAAFLAAYEAAAPDALQAAQGAARMEVLWVRLAEGKTCP